MNIIVPENRDNHYIAFDFRPTFKLKLSDYPEEITNLDQYIFIINKNNLGDDYRFYDNFSLAGIFSDPFFDVQSLDFVKQITSEKTLISKIIKAESKKPVYVKFLPTMGSLYIDTEKTILNTLTVKYSETREYDYLAKCPYYTINFEDYLPTKTNNKNDLGLEK